ncbi:Si-specific NAD(P)(+) transhydrogenase [Alloalcanivorax venustensis]|jgi:NAD(P) transhydrogenase|uniref:Soluble pyridine nucleotide transhydrogenase n=1 Tax=Alloalcanivorax venustensis ISO4 TaxID=1177184 RepID=A0ABS0AH25_9GAMM|nr:Si-specific NAD(P)(+) transhydrogenase [Alloalcanivorax venustensis]MAQ32856.1 Si-specific NAD(P)(+) transhydrogenase [Alcanivorax sp.]MEC8881627.1 Si-specific NAD(P)(+) transhydrogenase [Pseudomonadota bacterium]SMO71322.1 NAD(P) transhydrogenase [Alcanivorax sp. DSM 26295]MBA4731696.1 Si-specific NAD(P)(+) transhydrogenase [Alcanivorax sp.]MBF48637.1 Si-specific NAD(P)(+) transhydrogenase [Alcanivorax sp.]|tara:strand:- start:43967 stop:45367 length:1401 start_codon:yes stop_codon:yes gene_type:complete
MDISSGWDLVVLGSGPAGEAAAMQAAKGGLRVAMVDRDDQMGGNCTHWGTIPSKALRHQVRQVVRSQRNPLLRGLISPRQVRWQDLIQRSREVVDSQVQVRTDFYVRNRVRLFNGQGRIESAGEVRVDDQAGRQWSLRTRNILIATGSRPYRPADVDFDHPRIYDSDTILEMKHTPRNMIVYGAGVIGCEYSCLFTGLGIRVDLVNNRQHLLDFLDAEISDALSYHLRDQGATIRHSEEYTHIEADDDGVTLVLRSGKRLRADALMWSNGRSGNTQNIGLENLGLKPNSRGQLAVDERYQTEVAGVYAVGDVIGWPSLASASYDQGRFCAQGIVEGGPVKQVTDVPTGIYTIPGISSVGRTEQELTEARVPYEVGQAFFKNLARAQITGERVGMLKILFHRETLEVLGIHCFGYQAMEIVHVGQAVMRQPAPNNTLHYFVDTTFNYPTMAEGYRVAAINGMNRVSR